MNSNQNAKTTILEQNASEKYPDGVNFALIQRTAFIEGWKACSQHTQETLAEYKKVVENLEFYIKP